MYLAEIHGKLSRKNENKEDILTSNVFSFFKYADRKIFLYRFLQSLGLEITPEESLHAEFQFWPRFEDGSEPDLVILVGNYYLLLEAKYFSGFSDATERIEHQVVREIKGGQYEAKSRHKLFRIFAITAHYCFTPEIFRDVPPNYRDLIKWMNWQQIALTIYQAIEDYPEIPFETRLFAEDLYTLLLHKNLRTFAGTDVLGSVPRINPSPEPIFFDAVTAGFRGDFFGFQETLGTVGKIKTPDPMLFYNPRQSFFSALYRNTHRIKRLATKLFFGGTDE